jgi:hypothetical protein
MQKLRLEQLHWSEQLQQLWRWEQLQRWDQLIQLKKIRGLVKLSTKAGEDAYWQNIPNCKSYEILCSLPSKAKECHLIRFASISARFRGFFRIVLGGFYFNLCHGFSIIPKTSSPIISSSSLLFPFFFIGTRHRNSFELFCQLPSLWKHRRSWVCRPVRREAFLQIRGKTPYNTNFYTHTTVNSHKEHL